MRIFTVSILLLLAATAAAVLANPPASQPLAFDVVDGYFVSNQFEPDRPDSFLVLRDQRAFDGVFGVAMVMNDRAHRLPADAFDSKLVLAVVHRGKAVWTYRVTDVIVDGRALTLRYTATAQPQDSAEFACPLIVAIPRGDYASVRFQENGKLSKEIAPPTPAPTTSP